MSLYLLLQTVQYIIYHKMKQSKTKQNKAKQHNVTQRITA
jgi:hypothetical protein